MGNFAKKIKSDTLKTDDSQKKTEGIVLNDVDDRRPEAAQLNRLQQAAGKSPEVSQLQALQDKANNTSEIQESNNPKLVTDTPQPEKSVLQKKELEHVNQKENKTGLPDALKFGVESLSGTSLNDVKVYYNSDKPAQLQAHAFAQGTDIHVGSGQEKHLAHEAWHVVQQKQNRVQPTLETKDGIKVNDSKQLETEADVMGNKALQMKATNASNQTVSNINVNYSLSSRENKPIQKMPSVEEAKEGAKTGAGKLAEYTVDGLAHPLVSLYGVGKRYKEDREKGGTRKEGIKEGILGGKGNELGRAVNYPYYEAYGAGHAQLLRTLQGVSAVSGEVMKWSGSMAATGGLFMLIPATAPAATPFVTAATATTAIALATKTASRGIHATYSAEYANHFYDSMNSLKVPPDDDNLQKYFLILADSKHQNHGYGASLFQAAVLAGGGMAAENIGGSRAADAQLGNFLETVGFNEAGTTLGEAGAGLGIGTIANSQDDVEEWRGLNKSGRDQLDGDEKVVHTVAGMHGDHLGLSINKDFENDDGDRILNNTNLIERWEQVKKIDKFLPPKNKSFKKSKSLLLNPLYLLIRAFDGLLEMATMIQNSLRSKDEHKELTKDEHDPLHKYHVSDKNSGKEGLGRTMVKGAATGVGGVIAGSVGAGVGAVGGLMSGGYRGAKKGKEKGSNIFKQKEGDKISKRMAKKAGNFAGGAVGGILGGVGGGVAGAATGAVSGAKAGAMNVKDSVYGDDNASISKFAKNTLMGGVAGGVAASKAIGSADNLDALADNINANRSIDEQMNGCVAFITEIRKKLSHSQTQIRDTTGPAI